MRKQIQWIIVSSMLIFPGISHAQYFNHPESIVYDTLNSRYSVSNNGSGMIVQFTPTDTSFTSFEGSTGITIADNILYTVRGVNGIRGYDLATGDTVLSVTITGASMLNDPAADLQGNLFITDYNGNKIYKLNRQTGLYSIFVPGGLNYPNGILFDQENNRMLFVESLGGKIKAVNLADSTVTTVLSGGYGSMDGITMDGAGNIYVSSWATNSVYRYEGKTFSSPPTPVSSGHQGPADIYFNPKANVIAVPNFNGNYISFIELQPTAVKNQPIQTPGEFHLEQNYPNPFNPSTTISFNIPSRSFVLLKIFDLIGRDVATIVSEELSAGNHTKRWDATGMPSGVYFYRLEAGKFTETKKLVLLR